MRKFSHSSMSTFRRCRARYKWSYIDNYRTDSGLGQSRGSIGHAVLQNWYEHLDMEDQNERDELAMKVAANMYNDLEATMEQDFTADWDLMCVILPRYFDWARENDNFTRIVSLEQKFEIPIGKHTVIGYIDGVVEVNGGLWLLEHKFNKRVSTGHIDLDPQMSLYMLAAHTLGIDVRGVFFNVIRAAEGGIAAKEPVVRARVYRNQEGLSAIAYETETQLDEMEEFHRLGGRVYRNPTKDCSWDCGFYGACLAINDCGSPHEVLSKLPIVPHESSQDEKGESSE